MNDRERCDRTVAVGRRPPPAHPLLSSSPSFGDDAHGVGGSTNGTIVSFIEHLGTSILRLSCEFWPPVVVPHQNEIAYHGHAASGGGGRNASVFGGGRSPHAEKAKSTKRSPTSPISAVRKAVAETAMPVSAEARRVETASEATSLIVIGIAGTPSFGMLEAWMDGGLSARNLAFRAAVRKYRKQEHCTCVRRDPVNTGSRLHKSKVVRCVGLSPAKGSISATMCGLFYLELMSRNART